jgi:hypothetical protein
VKLPLDFKRLSYGAGQASNRMLIAGGSTVVCPLGGVPSPLSNEQTYPKLSYSQYTRCPTYSSAIMFAFEPPLIQDTVGPAKISTAKWSHWVSKRESISNKRSLAVRSSPNHMTMTATISLWVTLSSSDMNIRVVFMFLTTPTQTHQRECKNFGQRRSCPWHNKAGAGRHKFHL